MPFVNNIPFFSIMLCMVCGVSSAMLSGKVAKWITVALSAVVAALNFWLTMDLWFDHRSFTYMMGHFPAPWGNELRGGLVESTLAVCFSLIMLLSVLGGMRKMDQQVGKKLNLFCVMLDLVLAAMETGHIGTTVQLTDAGICPGSGVGNHRAAINRETMHVPVIAVGVPMVVYASTIVRDALQGILAAQSTQEDAHRMAEQLTKQAHTDLVVTPRNIDELVAGLADMLALAINSALQPSCTLEELSHYLH